MGGVRCSLSAGGETLLPRVYLNREGGAKRRCNPSGEENLGYLCPMMGRHDP